VRLPATNAIHSIVVTFRKREDAVADVVGHRRRRYLLYCLYIYSNPIKLTDIADQLIIWAKFEVGGTQRQEWLRIYKSLYHDHLPALQDADVVRYHEEDNMVELGPVGEQLEPTLERRYKTEVTDLLEAEAERIDAQESG
jgi:hypothetical protein